jgi:hypothetical protein
MPLTKTALLGQALTSLRGRKVRAEDQLAKRLRSVVADEVDFVYALWTGNLEKALQKARAVSDSLGGNGIKGYRGWWYYLAADAATHIYECTKGTEVLQVAREYYGRAANCSLSISWFAGLGRIAMPGAPISIQDILTPIAVETAHRSMLDLGLTGQGFEERMTVLLREIGSDDHDTFQRALKTLGSLLGFHSIIPGSDADPDCVWSIADKLHIAHEVKMEKTPGSIGACDARQAVGHINWIKANCPCSRDCEFLAVIETSRTTVESSALPHAHNLFHVALAEMRALAKQTVSVLRAIRAGCADTPDETLLDALRQEMGNYQLLPRHIQNRMTKQALSTLPAAKLAASQHAVS